MCTCCGGNYEGSNNTNWHLLNRNTLNHHYEYYILIKSGETDYLCVLTERGFLFDHQWRNDTTRNIHLLYLPCTTRWCSNPIRSTLTLMVWHNYVCKVSVSERSRVNYCGVNVLDYVLICYYIHLFFINSSTFCVASQRKREVERTYIYIYIVKIV